jgi:C4-dicarboxylate transporter, DctM subunit
VPLKDLSRAILPFVAVQLAALLILAFIPGLSLWLPHALGFR